MRWLAIAGCALLVAGCGGSPSASKSTTVGKTWVAFASCMRSNGVHAYPDPAGNGPPPKKSLQQLGVSSSAFAAAQSACRDVLPSGAQPSQAQQRQVAAESLLFSKCVRSHGIPNFPDPDSTGRIPDPATVGIDQGSPKFQSANDACAKYRPPYMPSNAAYNAYARSQGQ